MFRRVLPAEGVAVRYEGDEFTFLLPSVGPEQALKYCGEILRLLGQIDITEVLTAPAPGMLSGPVIDPVYGAVRHISASIGISSYPGDGETSSALLEKADRTLYRAKEEGYEPIWKWNLM